VSTGENEDESSNVRDFTPVSAKGTVGTPPNSSDACNGTNLMHCLSSVYSVTIILHVSDLLVAHYQEVTMYICNNWYVLYVLVDCQRA
jgi:hypothetical protein